MFEFRPIDDNNSDDLLKVPYFEHARADFAPYYRAIQNNTVRDAQLRVRNEFGKLGGDVTSFKEGDFSIGGLTRRGYQIEFVWRGAKGRIMVAGLPIEMGVTRNKLDSIKIQALLNVADWLKAAVTARIFSPGENPLIAHLVLRDGTTLAERVADELHLPMLPFATDFVEGEYIETPAKRRK